MPATPSSARPRRTLGPLAVVLVLLASTLVGLLVHRTSASWALPPRAVLDAVGVLDPGQDGIVDEADGVLPPGATAFDGQHPGIANLDPELLAALRAAAVAAAAEGITVVVNSGWRSVDHQAQLLREAVAEHGSEAEAARWVASPTTSPHVTGDAVDLGGPEALDWLAAHGSTYGLCRVYRNEPWHHELRPEAVTAGCPPPYDDPTHDPRMQVFAGSSRPPAPSSR